MYRFNDKRVDGQSLIPIINLMLGDEVVGAEVGSFRADSACTIMQNCPSIKKLYVIDSWKPYTDFIKEPYDNTPGRVLAEHEIEIIKFYAFHNIKYSGCVDRIQVMEMDSNDAALQIETNSLDFVFLDAHLTIEQLENDLNVWHSKVRTGGIIAVHDTHVGSVEQTILKFRSDNNINNRLSIFDQMHMWLK